MQGPSCGGVVAILPAHTLTPGALAFILESSGGDRVATSTLARQRCRLWSRVRGSARVHALVHRGYHHDVSDVSRPSWKARTTLRYTNPTKAVDTRVPRRHSAPIQDLELPINPAF